MMKISSINRFFGLSSYLNFLLVLPINGFAYAGAITAQFLYLCHNDYCSCSNSRGVEIKLF